jgi:hypothetical protein
MNISTVSNPINFFIVFFFLNSLMIFKIKTGEGSGLAASCLSL